MKKLKIILLTVCLFVPYLHLSSQQTTEFGIKFSGYVKTDVFYDSRQTVKAREGEFELYPAAISNDITGSDVNAVPSMNMLSLQTRLTGKITAPDVLGAKTSGVIEGEFFGTSDADVNGFRLRLGYINLNWSNSTQLLIGQNWHPLFIPEAAPQVIAYNTGTPFKTLSRNPQIRLTQSITDAISIAVAASTQRDFQSYGPTSATNWASTASASFEQNASIPNADIQLLVKTDQFLFGLTGDYKVLEPLQSIGTGATFRKTKETIASAAGQVTAKATIDNFSIAAEGLYGQNLADQFLIGGYAVKSIDATTGIPTFTNFNTLSCWTDVSYGTTVQAGVFAGYIENEGTSDNIVNTTYVYGRGTNIKDIYRIAPRLVWNIKKLRLGCECEYTSAEYGTNNITDKAKVINTSTVSNVRILFGAYLFF